MGAKQPRDYAGPILRIATDWTNLDKYLLFTPGPVNVAETLRKAISKKDICHRERDFDALLASIEHKVLSLFQISNSYRTPIATERGRK